MEIIDNLEDEAAEVQKPEGMPPLRPDEPVPEEDFSMEDSVVVLDEIYPPEMPAPPKKRIRPEWILAAIALLAAAALAWVAILCRPYYQAADDPKAKTVMDLVPEAYRKLGVMPVGRLDKDTEGLLLLTNDGDLAHRILSPRHGVWKRYYAEHEGTAGPADVRAFEAGLVLADGLHCLPAKLTPLGPGRSVVEVQEGKYHQVRRMLASRGLPVTYLRREAEGRLTLGDLPLGQTKELNIVEAEQLLLNIL